jgi:hypothetical protein
MIVTAGPHMQKIAVGQRLEAIDRKNPSLLCVATVSSIQVKDGKEVLTIHFDGWTNTYDYQVCPSYLSRLGKHFISIPT